MKKVSMFAAVLAGIMAMSSCGSSTSVKDVTLKTEYDSLAYALAVVQTDGLKPYLAGRMNIDTTAANMDEFMKGVLEARKQMDSKKKAYIAGLQIGEQFSDQMLPGFAQTVFAGDSTKKLNEDAFYSALAAAIKGKGVQMTPEDASQYVETTIARIQQSESETKFGGNKAKGQAFMDSIKAVEGVVTTEDGLAYQVLKEGKGEKPTTESRVKVHYHGTLIDGTVFDSSVDRGEPVEFGVTEVIPGWTEGLQLMTVGSKYKFYIPYNLAYGERNTGRIEPFSTLVFEVELLSIEK